MKKYIALTIVIVLSLIFLCGCSKKEPTDDLSIIKKRGYVIVGVKTDSAPFGYYNEKGQISGYDIEISKYIANSIFKDDSWANIKFVPVTAQNRISKLNSKEVDILVATMSVNEKRKMIMNFSMPYFEANQKIMVPKTSQITGLRYFNKNGKLVVVMGTTGEKIIRLIAPNAHVVGARTYHEALNYLRNFQADAILGDDCILTALNDGNYKLINRSYSREYYAVAVRKNEESKELLNEVNSAIASFLDDRKINFIKK